MALPKIIQRLFESAGFGQYLNLDIIPNHADIHRSGNRDPIKIDASQITSGTISILRLPSSVKERAILVNSKEDMLFLTKDNVQNGDDILIKDTGVWYKVINDDALDKISSYSIFGSNNISESGDVESAKSVKMEVIYTSTDYTINNTKSGCILCCDNTLLVNLDNRNMTNGWNFYIKNTSTQYIVTVASILGSTIDSLDEYKIPPLITVQFIYDGKNFITISNASIITL